MNTDNTKNVLGNICLVTLFNYIKFRDIILASKRYSLIDIFCYLILIYKNVIVGFCGCFITTEVGCWKLTEKKQPT